MKSIRPLLVAASATLLLGSQMASTAGAAGAHSPTSATAPRKLALTTAEVSAVMGSGFTRQSVGGQQDLVSGAAGLQIARKAGYVSGYEASFTRLHPVPLMVVSGVNLLRSTAFARSSVQRILTVYGSAVNRRAGVRAMPMSGIGDRAAGFTYSESTQGGKTIAGFGIVFSRGVYAGEVLAYTAGSVDRARVLTLARTLDNRIAKA